MKAKNYKLLDECVEDGVQLGYERAHKHTNTPTKEQLVDCIHSAIMTEIEEWFDITGEAL